MDQPNINFAEQMSQTRFCLSAPGQRGGDSDRYLPAVLMGCIPVLLPDDDVMPFQDEVVPWDDFSVSIVINIFHCVLAYLHSYFHPFSPSLPPSLSLSCSLQSYMYTLSM